MRGAGSSGSAEHTVVVGAGPAGLTAAYELSRQGLPVTVVEKDGAIGGFGQTLEFMGCRFDLGPRPLYVVDDEVEALLTSVLGRELRPVARVSRGLYRGQLFSRPLRLSDVLVKLGPVEAARCAGSFARARLRPRARPIEPLASVDEPVSSELVRRLSEIFVDSHRGKVWGDSGGEVSGSVRAWGPGETTRAFRYPRRGAGQIWEALAGRIEAAGGGVRLGEEVVAVRHGRGRMLSVVVCDQQGLLMDVMASQFVSTMPIKDLVARLWPEPPDAVRAAAAALRYRELITVNLVIDRDGVFPDQWIDVLDPAVQVARISNFRNFSRAMVSDSGLSGLGMEYFCDAGDGLWQMADRELLDLARRELVALGLCQAHEVKAGMVSRWPKAFVVRNRRYWDAAEVVWEWIGRSLPNLWLAEGAEGPLVDQGEAMASGMAAAGVITRRASAPRDVRVADVSAHTEALAVAVVGGYTEPAVPE